MSPCLRLLVIAAFALGGCSTGPGQAAPVPIVSASPADLGVTSVPAAGSTVTGPINQLELNFNRPVQLSEVTVTGPDGTMPMMLSPAGAQSHFAVPVPGLTAGAYSVSWKAIVDGQAKTGSFAFTVK